MTPGPNLEIRAVFDIGQKGHFSEKKGTKNFLNSYVIPFLSVFIKLTLYIVFTKGDSVRLSDAWKV